MDTPPLVNGQIRLGAKLLTRLLEIGFPVIAAFWAKTQKYAQWRLYLVSPAPIGDGEESLFWRMRQAAATVNFRSDDPFEPVVDLDTWPVMIVRPDHPLAAGMLRRYELAPDSTPALFDWAVIGTTTVDGAYLYPAAMFPKPLPAVGA